MADINRLPNEILIRIFHFYLQSEGQRNFFYFIPYVCRKWNEVSKDSSFFETLDGSLPLHCIVEFAKAGYLQTTKTLKFGEHRSNRNDQYKTIYSHMPSLKHLYLSNYVFNGMEEPVLLTELEGLCPDLCELVLRFPLYKSLEKFIFHRGPKIVKLDFSGDVTLNFEKLFVHIAQICPNLEELFVRNNRKSQGINVSNYLGQFPILKMQHGCQKLKLLFLGYPISYTQESREDAIGFPKLEVFRHPSTRVDDRYFQSSDLQVLLCNSPNLKILDLRGCVLLNYEDLQSLPAVNLEQIYLSWTRIAQTRNVTNVFNKWSHSLSIINLSNVKGENINNVFLPQHLPDGLPKLRVLYGNNTSITAETLKIIIQQCPKLRFFNVEGCNRLKQDLRKIYSSRVTIEELLLKLDFDCA